MAIKGIYVADGTTKYTSADVKLVNGKIVGGKIIYGDTDLKVEAQSTPNMSVKVSAGLCSINGVFLQNDSSYTVTIDSNTESYPRIDAIVAYISGTTLSIKVVKGTASASPIAPSVSASTYVKLAEVTVGVGVTSIQSTVVKDCRKDNNQLIIDSLTDEINTLKNYNTNNQSLNSFGYQEFNGGFKVNWGSFLTTPGNGAGDIYLDFEKGFTNCVYANFILRPATANAVDTSQHLVSWSNTRIRIRFTGARQENHSVYWFAIGW